MVELIFGENMLGIAKEILNLNPSTGNYATIWQVVNNIYDNICVPIGMGLVLIYFMVNLIERSMQQQQLDIEHIVKALLKLVVGLYFIKNGLQLMASIYSMGFSFLNGVVDATSSDGSSGSDIAKGAWMALTGEDWEGKWSLLDFLNKGITIFLVLIIPFIGVWIMQLVLCAVCFFRLIEFYVLTCSAPIALSDFYTEGVHGNGWKFLKSYIALALQMGIIMLAIVAFNGILAGLLPNCAFWSTALEITNAVAANGGTMEGAAGAGVLGAAGTYLGEFLLFIVQYLGLAAACIAVVLKSRSLAKEIVGVQ